MLNTVKAWMITLEIKLQLKNSNHDRLKCGKELGKFKMAYHSSTTDIHKHLT